VKNLVVKCFLRNCYKERKSKLIYDRQSVGQSVPVSGALLGPATNFSFSLKMFFRQLRLCSFVAQSLMRGRVSVIYCTIASGPCQSSHSWAEVPQNSSSRIYIPQEQGGPVIPSGTGFPFYRLLRLAGLRWRYSNLPPHVCKRNVRYI
jgi:hypothetical protein